jgi:hypothetical protein
VPARHPLEALAISAGAAANLEALATARRQSVLDVDTILRRHQERERAARLKELMWRNGKITRHGKRGMKGIYRHCSEKHLHRYLAEFGFQYSNRSALGVEDQERASRALLGITGKRLTDRGTDFGA